MQILYNETSDKEGDFVKLSERIAELRKVNGMTQEDNLGLIDTKLDVHCEAGESGGKLEFPLKNNVKLTNTCALVILDLPDNMEIIGE